jgi:hypothetical protein
MEMGQCRTRYGALGIVAVTRLVRLALPLLTLPVLLAACNSIGAISGAVVGVAAGGATTNPLVGYAVGVGTQATVDEAVKYVMRKRQQAEQDEIAAVIAPLPVGQTAAWKINHDLPFGNEHGNVTVLRNIDNALTTCKEVVFTVIDGDTADAPRSRFVSSACRQQDGWKWAAAEPAVTRWGFLQ